MEITGFFKQQKSKQNKKPDGTCSQSAAVARGSDEEGDELSYYQATTADVTGITSHQTSDDDTSIERSGTIVTSQPTS